MDTQQLKATRTQLMYEFGEIEYERNLHIQRLNYLDKQYESKIQELHEIELQINDMNQSVEKTGMPELYIEKNNEISLKSQ